MAINEDTVARQPSIAAFGESCRVKVRKLYTMEGAEMPTRLLL